MDRAPVISLAVSPKYGIDGTLYVGTEAHGVWCSEDRGASWNALQDGLADEPVNGIALGPKGAADQALLVLWGSRLLYTLDRGQSWQSIASEADEDAELTAVVAPNGFAPDSPLLVGTSDGEIKRLP
jgi:hypothetical protein